MPAHDPRVRRASSSLAAIVRWHPGADTAEARSGLKAANLAAQIKRDVSTWPPLSADVRAELAGLLLTAGDDGAA
jgi:hypothetical protein